MKSLLAVVLAPSLVAVTLAVAAPADAAPLPTVTSTSSSRVAPNSHGPLAGLSVSNVSSGDVQATLATNLGTVSISDATIGGATGVTLSYGNHSSGDAQLTLIGSETQVNAALATAALTTGDNAGRTATVSLAATPVDPDRFYLASTQHYYQYVSAPGTSWTDADTAAKALTVQGQRGYLATIPDATVNDFAASRIPNASNVWFAARAYNYEGTHDRTWRWAKGTDESPRQGRAISNCDNAGYFATCNFADDAGLYHAWSAGQPDNTGQTCEERYITNDGTHYFYQYGCWGGGEDYGNANWSRAGEWNDLPNSSTGVTGYLVEYGDRETGSSGFDQTYTDTSDVLVAGTPGAPANVTATGNNGSASVSFDAPAANGSAITGYTVTSTPGGKTATCPTGPCTVTGLTNGTAYTFAVVATNAVGSGAASGFSNSVTPVTVPGAATHVVATRGNGNVTVTWQAPVDGGSPITGYLVTASPGGATCSTTGATRCTFAKLPAGRSYTFRVRATTANGVSTSGPSAPALVSGRPSAPSRLRVVAGDRVLTITYAPPADNGGARISAYQVSIDAGRHWLPARSTKAVVPGVRNGTTFRVVVRAVNANGAGPRSAVATASTRSWFRDPVSARTRKSQLAVPAHPARYRGPVRATRASARSHNGTPAVPASSLHGRQLQAGQATSLGADGLFGFDSAALNSAGKRQVKAIARSLRYARSVVCEGYADYGGGSAHQKSLSRQRAKALCRALVRAGAHVRTKAKGYGAGRPAVVGGTSDNRVANRRVVLLVTN